MLTRSQVIGLFGFAMELPVDTHFELAPQEPSGDILVTATTESWEGRRIAKLSPRGGYESIVNDIVRPTAEAYDLDRKS